MILPSQTADAKAAYAADLQRSPRYHDGTPRPLWDALPDIAKLSWIRNPSSAARDGFIRHTTTGYFWNEEHQDWREWNENTHYEARPADLPEHGRWDPIDSEPDSVLIERWLENHPAAALRIAKVAVRRLRCPEGFAYDDGPEVSGADYIEDISTILSESGAEDALKLIFAGVLDLSVAEPSATS